jgi:hypothetical protein
LRVEAAFLRLGQRILIFPVELFHDDGRAPARLHPLPQQLVARLVALGVVVHLAQQQHLRIAHRLGRRHRRHRDRRFAAAGAAGQQGQRRQNQCRFHAICGIHLICRNVHRIYWLKKCKSSAPPAGPVTLLLRRKKIITLGQIQMALCY